MLSAFRRYLNLCSEELWLHKQGRIDKETWGIWCDGIRDTAQFPSFKYSWDFLRCEYEYFVDFCAFMDQLVEELYGPAEAVTSHSDAQSSD